MSSLTVKLDRSFFVNYLCWLLEKGFSVNEVLSYTDISPEQLRSMLKGYGVSLDRLFLHMKPEVAKDALNDYTNGMSPSELRKKYGLTISEIRNYCFVNGIDDASCPVFRGKHASQLRKEGKTLSEIQEILGLNSRQAVAELIDTFEEQQEKITKCLSDRKINPDANPENVLDTLVVIAQILSSDGSPTEKINKVDAIIPAIRGLG